MHTWVDRLGKAILITFILSLRAVWATWLHIVRYKVVCNLYSPLHHGYDCSIYLQDFGCQIWQLRNCFLLVLTRKSGASLTVCRARWTSSTPCWRTYWSLCCHGHRRLGFSSSSRSARYLWERAATRFTRGRFAGIFCRTNLWQPHMITGSIPSVIDY